jgi:hypothetical protein
MPLLAVLLLLTDVGADGDKVVLFLVLQLAVVMAAG